MVVLDGGVATLGEPLGQGGMGTVYRGRLRGHEALVAVKLLRVEGLDPAARAGLAARLADEATAAAAVVHPNLVRLVASGLCPEHGPYVVYELVEGGTLTERLGQGPLPWEEVEEQLAPQLLGALGALHAAGIVHRDVKPDNVFVTPEGRYLLGDLGLAVFEGRSALTATGVVVGTPGYLAPERITRPDLSPTPAADVYAAAMVLVRAVAGRLPFSAAAPAGLVAEQVRRRLSAQELAASGIPRPAAPVLAAALDPDPDGRPPTAAALAQRLAEARRTASSAPPAATVTGAGTVPRLARRARAAKAPAAAPVPRGPRRLAPVAALLAVLAVLILVVPWPRSSPSSADPPEARADGLTGLVLLSRPLLPDEAVRRLVADPSLLRLVALGAGTASPAGVGARHLVDPASPAALSETARSYADLLRSAEPEPAATSTLLLTELLGRLKPPAPEVDELALSTFGVLARLPPAVREGPRGRSLALCLELHLASATAGGMSAASREGLGAALADPDLDGAPRRLGAAMGLTVPAAADPRAHRDLVERLAEAPLARSEGRIEDFSTLNTYQLSLVRGQGSDLLRRAAERLTADWYGLLPLALVDPGPPPPAAESSARREMASLALRLTHRREFVVRRQDLAQMASGPFGDLAFLGRLGLVDVILAQRVAAGDEDAAAALVGALNELLARDEAVASGPGRAVPFLDLVDEFLQSAPGPRTALLTLRGHRLVGDPERAAEGRRLLVDAASVSLEATDASPTQARVAALVSAVGRVRRLASTGEESLRRDGLVERVRVAGERLASTPSLDESVKASLRKLLRDLGEEAR